MASRLQTVEVRISGNVKDVLTSFQRVEVAGDRLGTKISSGVTRSFRDLGIAVAGAAGAFLSFEGLSRTSRFIFDTNVQFQRLRATLNTVTGSVEAGAAAFDMIKQFTLTTPFLVSNITEAFTQLRVRGFQPTMDELRGLGNFAAAFNKEFTDLSDAIVSLVAGQVRPMRRFGVNATVAGDKAILSFKGVTKVVDRTASAISDFLVQVGNTKFADAMANRMQTLQGQMSNLHDVTMFLATAIGDAGLNGEIIHLIEDLRAAVTQGNHFAETVGHAMAGGVKLADDALTLLVDHIGTLITATEVLAGAAIGRSLAGLAARVGAAAAVSGDLGAAVLGLAGGPVGAVLALAGAIGGPLVLHLLTARSEAEKFGDAIQAATRKAEGLGAPAIRAKIASYEAQLSGLVEQAGRFRTSLDAAQKAGAGGLARDFENQLDKNRQKATALSAAIADLRAKLKALVKPTEDDSAAGDAHAQAITKLLDSLQAEHDKLALTSRELLVKQLRENGASEATINHALALQSANDLLQAQQAEAKKAADALAKYRKAQENAYAKFPQAKGPLEKAIDRERKAIAQSKAAELAWEEQLARTSDRAAGDVSDAFLSIIQGTKSVSAAFRDMVDQIAAEMLRLTIQQTVTKPLANALSAFLTHAFGHGAAGTGSGTPAPGPPVFAGFAAAGATVGPGQFVIAGERGPEAIVGPGTVLPMARGSAGGGTTVHVHQNITFAPSFLDAAGADAWLMRRQGTVGRVVADLAAKHTGFRQALVTGRRS